MMNKRVLSGIAGIAIIIMMLIMILFLYAVGMYIVWCYIDKDGDNIISSWGKGEGGNTNTHKAMVW